MKLHVPGPNQYGNASCKSEFGRVPKGWHQTALGCVPISHWTWQGIVVAIVLGTALVVGIGYTVWHLTIGVDREGVVNPESPRRRSLTD